MQNQVDNGDTEQNTRKIQFWNRVQLLLILVVFAAPIAGAFFYKPTKFNNYGDIYSPVRPISNLLMQGADGEVEMDSFRRQWIFLVTANNKCGEACEDNILKMRQLRFMQNNDMTRIRTVFLHTGVHPDIAQDLAAKYSPIESYSVPFNDYDEWTQILKIEGAPPESQKDRFYIIDPAGNLMMSYPASADPNIMKKDIKRLLKTSQIG
ncbi:MAG: hypothetical protein AAF431_05515 [Pseudomonadota bacterium]